MDEAAKLGKAPGEIQGLFYYLVFMAGSYRQAQPLRQGSEKARDYSRAFFIWRRGNLSDAPPDRLYTAPG